MNDKTLEQLKDELDALYKEIVNKGKAVLLNYLGIVESQPNIEQINIKIELPDNRSIEGFNAVQLKKGILYLSNFDNAVHKRVEDVVNSVNAANQLVKAIDKLTSVSAQEQNTHPAPQA